MQLTNTYATAGGNAVLLSIGPLGANFFEILKVESKLENFLQESAY